MKLFFFEKNQRCKIDVKWVGNGRGRLRPVQNDRTGFPEVLGPILVKNVWKINGKTMFFCFVPTGLCHFPENSYTNGWSPYDVRTCLVCSFLWFIFKGVLLLYEPGHAQHLSISNK